MEPETKKKRYGLRGVVCGLFVSLLFFSLAIYTTLSGNSYGSPDVILTGRFLFGIFWYTFWFVLFGAILGWIFGKVVQMNQKFWLKGGIIMLGMSILSVAFIFLGVLACYDSCPKVLGYLPLLFLLPLYVAEEYLNVDLEGLILLLYLLNFLIYFLFGSIIGWIYGKVKNRKSANSLSV